MISEHSAASVATASSLASATSEPLSPSSPVAPGALKLPVKKRSKFQRAAKLTKLSVGITAANEREKMSEDKNAGAAPRPGAYALENHSAKARFFACALRLLVSMFGCTSSTGPTWLCLETMVNTRQGCKTPKHACERERRSCPSSSSLPLRMRTKTGKQITPGSLAVLVHPSCFLVLRGARHMAQKRTHTCQARAAQAAHHSGEQAV